MFEQLPEFEKPHYSEEGAPAPSRSPSEPLTMIGLVGIAVAIVVVVVLARAF